MSNLIPDSALRPLGSVSVERCEADPIGESDSPLTPHAEQVLANFIFGLGADAMRHTANEYAKR